MKTKGVKIQILKRKKADEMSDLRPPSNEVRSAIARVEEVRATRLSKVGIVFAAITIFAGVACAFGAVSATETTGKVMAYATACVLVVLGTCLALAGERTKREATFFQSGEFSTTTGRVRGSCKPSDRPGTCYVRFESDRGEILEGLWEARGRGIDNGSPLLLAYASDERLNGGRPFVRLYSEDELGVELESRKGTVPF